jgi:hypothetical protein
MFISTKLILVINYLLSTGLIKKESDGEYGTIIKKNKMKRYFQNVSHELLNILWSIVDNPSASRGCFTATPRSLLIK